MELGVRGERHNVLRWLAIVAFVTGSGLSQPGVAEVAGAAWDWSHVELEARKFMLVAHVSVRITAPSATQLERELVRVSGHRELGVPPGGVWRIEAENRLPGVSSRVTVWLARDTLQLLQRERFDSIHRGRYKRTRFLEEGAYEWQRRGAGAPRGSAPERWPLKRERLLPAARSEPCTDSLGLLLLAPELVRSERMRTQARLCTDDGSIGVMLTHQGDARYPVTHARVRAGTPLRSESRTPCAHVGIALENENEGTDDFRLLGLTGRLQLCIDMESGAPLQLTGTEPRLGSFTINAMRVEYGGAQGGAEPAAGSAPGT